MSDPKPPGPPPFPNPAPVSAPRAGTVPPEVRAAQARALGAVQLDASGRPVVVPPAGAPPRPAAIPVPRPAMPGAAAAAAAAAAAPKPPPAPPKPEFFPLEPRTWDEAGVEANQVEALLLRGMLGSRSETGRSIAESIGLPLTLVREVLDAAKDKKLVNYRGTTALGDFLCELTDAGRDAALESRKLTAYVGKCPVPWDHYVEALRYQGLAGVNPGPDELAAAFADLYVNEDLFDLLGPAVTSGKALFLHGEPGNGKTSLAERMTRCYGGTIWIPETLDVGGVLVKLFDPSVHKVAEAGPSVHRGRDRRWVRIERPTVVVGGELTLEMLELRTDPNTRISEAPLQLKANAGTLVIDDFGRGRTLPRDLLNRWIVPLEKQVDFLSLPDGRTVSAPFDALLVFSTNLEPSDLADEAFLRRIPYKIHVGDPDEHEFAQLVETMAAKLGVILEPRSVRYLVDRHYKLAKRSMRMCHPRDLLLQVVHLCEYERRPRTAGPREWDRVVANYFGASSGARRLSPDQNE
jgi:hypothetical protein